MENTVGTLTENSPFEEGPSSTGPKSSIQNQHGNYEESKLLRAGDIETQPGPRLTEVINKIYKLQNALSNPQPQTDIATQVDDITNMASPRIEKRGIMKNRGPIVMNDYVAYSESKLIQSGDIETQPGPVKLNIIKVTSILLTTFMILLIITVAVCNKEITQNSPKLHTISPSIITTKQSLISLCNILTHRNKKRKIHIQIRSTAAYLLIVLLMSGDIHPHPGPNIEHCLLCKQPENRIKLLTCNTCRGWCHISCTDQRQSNLPSFTKKDYQWHCPNTMCLPNHQESIESTLKQTPNRYHILTKKGQATEKSLKVVTTDATAEADNITTEALFGDDDVSTNNRNSADPAHTDDLTAADVFSPKVPTATDDDVSLNSLRAANAYIATEAHTKRKMKQTIIKTHHQRSLRCGKLWKELTKISPKDYEGKELCKACQKAIYKAQRAISCDLCQRWTHQKCSDMSMKVYKANSNKVFPWVCNTCRKPEEPDQITDIKKLKPEEMPTTNENFKADKDELVILHYNCRSTVNALIFGRTNFRTFLFSDV